jgi:hypothetical protein
MLGEQRLWASGLTILNYLDLNQHPSQSRFSQEVAGMAS